MPAREAQEPIACPECGRLYRYRSLSPGEAARCGRCDAVLYRARQGMEDRAIALTATGLVLFLLTNSFPLLGLRAQSSMMELSLLDASVAFWREGFPMLSGILLLGTFVFPLLELVAVMVVMLTIRQDLPRRPAILLYRWLREIRPWSMLEVFMLGILVAVVKLGDLATLVIGPAFWSFCGLVVVLAALRAAIDPFTVWRRLGQERCA